jgi:hypothetical protein
MKKIFKLATFAFLVAAIAGCALAQTTVEPPVAALANLTEGQGVATGDSHDWEGWSELTLIPGGGLLGTSPKSFVITLGFSAGSTVNVANMALYTTARASNLVTAVKKVTLGKKANPTIDLTSTANCPVQPVSVTNPCFIKTDAIKVTLSPLDDYYFVEYFTSDSNNNTVRGAGSSGFLGALSGWLIDGDDTRIPVGGTIPVGYTGQSPVFTMYITNE